MPPLNGEIGRTSAGPDHDQLQASTDLRAQQRELFAYFDHVQPISFLARLAGKLGLIHEVQSPKALYRAEGQEGNAFTRAWLTRDLHDYDTATLVTDVVHVRETFEVVPDSEQVQVTVRRDGELLTAPRNLVSHEVTLNFLEDSGDTADRVGQEMARETISRPNYMSP